MDLRTYLFNKRQSVVSFSKEINYHQNFVYGVISGRLKAGFRFAEIVEKHTNGEVTIQEVINAKNKKICPHCKGIL